MVVDGNRVDVVVESGPLHYSPPEGALVERWRRTFLAARQFGADSDKIEGRNKQIYLLFSLEAEDLQLHGGGGFAAGGGGRLGGLARGGGKAGDTFSSEKTGFNLSTETLSC